MSLTAQLLLSTGILHCGVGFAVPELREPLMRTLREGISTNTDTNERYAREASFWFQFGGLMMIVSALQIRLYWKEVEKEMPAWYGWILGGISAGAVVIMPHSGFWLALAQGARIVWINRRSSNKMVGKKK